MGLMTSFQQEILLWCAEINFCINMEEMKELVGDFRRSHTLSACLVMEQLWKCFTASHILESTFQGIGVVLKHLQPT